MENRPTLSNSCIIALILSILGFVTGFFFIGLILDLVAIILGGIAMETAEPGEYPWTIVSIVIASLGMICAMMFFLYKWSPVRENGIAMEYDDYEYDMDPEDYDFTDYEGDEFEFDNGDYDFESNNGDYVFEDTDLTEGIDVDRDLFNVNITVPADFVGDITQEELDQKADKDHFHSAKLNDDGSVTYVMSKAQHKAMMKEVAESIDETLNKMVGSSDYPNITEVSANNDYTSFRIVTKNEEPDLQESVSVLGLYMYGAMYSYFNGTPTDNIHVDFINAVTGEVIDSADSSKLGSDVEQNKSDVKSIELTENRDIQPVASNSSDGSSFDTYYNPQLHETTDSYVLNTSTYMIHYPWCNDVERMKIENYDTSNLSIDELQAQGYKPCGHCKPM